MESLRRVSLQSGGVYYTPSSNDAYRIADGSVVVFIIPTKRGSVGRRTYICELNRGETIPGFAFTDEENKTWYFCLSALGSAEIEIVEGGSTKVLKQRFAEKTGLENYGKESFQGAIIEQYRANILKEEILISKMQRDQSTTRRKILNLIADSFRNGRVDIDIDRSGNLLYDTAAVLCKRYSIPLAPYEKMKDAYGDGFGVPELARLSYFSVRKVVLEEKWYEKDSGPFLIFRTDGYPMLCLPKGSSSYLLIDVDRNSAVKITEDVAAGLSSEAYMFYRPLPAKKLEKRDFFAFCKSSVRRFDAIMLPVLTVVTALIGVITPSLSSKIYDSYIPGGEKTALIYIAALLGSFLLGNLMLSVVKNLVNYRLVSRMIYDVHSAVYDRAFNFPESFYRKFESADLAMRINTVSEVVGSYANVYITSAVALVLSVIYFGVMLHFSVSLSLVGILMLMIYTLIVFFINEASLRYSREAAELEGRSRSVIFQFIRGIDKIRIAGVEDRAILEYMKPYVRNREVISRANNLAGFRSAFSAVIGTVFTIVFYSIIYSMLKKDPSTALTTGSFLAFSSLFGTFEAYMFEVVGGALSIRALKPSIERIRPILDTVPEYDDAKEAPGDISGAIEINNVSFSYSPEEPEVLHGIDLDIKAGEYVGIVGPSGCGKSTLMRLLLGFERPSSGKIYFDNRDIESVDKRELRKKMGVVLQNGRLITGSILENIIITAPSALRADPQALQNAVSYVISAVGLAEDIAKMPMGLYTMLSEESATISGGQQQRILIARAIISSPKILLFDEATSALDNITQSLVSRTLDSLGSTRIVIAHRLSTIMKCDRIIVMDDGRIVEQGTFDELMQAGGLFAELAGRQMA